MNDTYWDRLIAIYERYLLRQAHSEYMNDTYWDKLIRNIWTILIETSLLQYMNDIYWDRLSQYMNDKSQLLTLSLESNLVFSIELSSNYISISQIAVLAGVYNSEIIMKTQLGMIYHIYYQISTLYNKKFNHLNCLTPQCLYHKYKFVILILINEVNKG